MKLKPGFHWSRGENALLLAWSGPDVALAKRLGRTASAVRSRRKLLLAKQGGAKPRPKQAIRGFITPPRYDANGRMVERAGSYQSPRPEDRRRAELRRRIEDHEDARRLAREVGDW